MNSEDSNSKQGKMEEKELVENLEFMRSAMAKARRDFDPGAVGMIAWGLACLIGYVAMHFLATPTHYKLILPMWVLAARELWI